MTSHENTELAQLTRAMWDGDVLGIDEAEYEIGLEDI